MRHGCSWLLAATLLGSGCAATPTAVRSAEPPPRAVTATPTPPQTVRTSLGVDESDLQGRTIEVWHPWFGVEAEFFEALLEEFNESNSWGITASATGQINFSFLYENVTTALPTTRRPDVVIALPEHALAWDAEGLVADLGPYVDDAAYGTEPGDFQILFWNQDLAAGKRVGLPAQRSARFLLWNQSFAQQLGLKGPPLTSTAFEQQACAANRSMKSDASPANDGMGGWLVDTDTWTAYAWLLAFQGAVLESDDYRFLTPNNIAALTFVKGLQEKGCAWGPRAGNDARVAFAERRAFAVAASLEDLPEQARAFAQAGSSDEWIAIAFPGDEVVPVYGSSYVLFSSTPEQQLAGWLLMRWLTEPEQDARWVETTHLFPLRHSTIDLLGDYRDSHPQWGQVVDLLPNSYLQPQLASWRTVKVMLEDGFACLFSEVPLCQQPPVVLAQMESAARELSD